MPETPAIEVRPLNASRRADYLCFFDERAFTDTPRWAGCYCYYPQHDPKATDWQQSSADDNRAAICACLDAGTVQGWLAYRDGAVAGWCNAGPRRLYPMLADSPELPPDDRRTGAVFCFVVAPGERRRGIAARDAGASGSAGASGRARDAGSAGASGPARAGDVRVAGGRGGEERAGRDTSRGAGAADAASAALRTSRRSPRAARQQAGREGGGAAPAQRADTTPAPTRRRRRGAARRSASTRWPRRSPRRPSTAGWRRWRGSTRRSSSGASPRGWPSCPTRTSFGARSRRRWRRACASCRTRSRYYRLPKLHIKKIKGGIVGHMLSS